MINTKHALFAHAKASGKRDRIMAAVNLAQSDPSVVTPLERFDADPMLLGVRNGFIDLRNGSFHAPDREKMISRSGFSDYEYDATCPRWMNFLEKILPDPDVRLYLQRAVGYTLTGLTDEQCFFFLWGLGANGKSTLINILAKLLGSYADSIPADALMARNSRHPEIFARLTGKRMVVSSELDEGQRFSESLIKLLTGGDMLVARQMYGSSFEFKPQFKLFVAGNYKPEIRGMDHGIWRRVKLISFEVKIPAGEIDKNLDEKLLTEMPGILNWAIDGCLSWQKAGLVEPQAILKATEGYHAESNVVGKWISEHCKTGHTESCLLKVLYQDFVCWAEDNGEHVIPRKQFTPKLEANGYAKDGKRTNSGYKIMGINLHN